MGTVESNVGLTSVKQKLKKEQRQLFFKRLISNKLMVTGGMTILFLMIVTLIGPFLVSHDPYEMVVQDRLQAPSAEHLLGTDEFGRDLLSRIIHGSKVTMGVGFSVAAITSLLGMIIGLYASYYRFLDHILMRICDGLMSIPAILLGIALMAALGPNTKNVIIALSIVFTPHVARVIRSAAIVVREQTYIEAMKAQGASTWRIIWGHMMPNTISPLVVQATFIFADAIITEAALSFLGAGVPAPDPSWGNILYDGKLVIFNAWWMTVFPGIMIVLSVLGLNLLGDGLRDLIDPHTNQGKK
ncbi:ABC transporter permease [Pseudogracilibacillus auburnensis]|uniref:Peptide/nickel transport system permease protein n=1 Tax=Pseudogracilibacillus auburnensis TaxID=1494959 RepID=A0A2V3VX77_9BACI|nr:ABC transporter permease [Pseudogracilibacillus auburnensis]MBO1002364.1 ABC transporter permease [Pseudogracilibacillus auburnensis]PXW86246.1 peptide/nickel transport system permease protein [Pseudogracilibacillus auburnensis]